MTTYYVSKTGNNGNGLSLANAKTTIAAGIALLTNSDKLMINDGTYNEAILRTLPAGLSATNPTIVQAINRNQVILKPATGNAYVIWIDRNNITIDGLYLDCSNKQINSVAPMAGILGQANNLTFIRSTVYNSGGGTGGNDEASGVALDGDSNLVSDNDVINCGNHTAEHGIYSIGTNLIIENNRVSGSYGWNIHFNTSGGPVVGTGPIIRNNTCKNAVNYSGILVNGCTNPQIYNNVCYNNAQHGIELQWTNNIYSAKIYSNTCYNNAGSGIYLSTRANDTVVQNNLLISNAVALSDSGINTTANSNYSFGIATQHFVSAASGNFNLISSSQAINAGATLGSPYNVDILGVSRPQPSGGLYDCGAYEFVTSTNRLFIASATFTNSVFQILGTPNDSSWVQTQAAPDSGYYSGTGLFTGGNEGNIPYIYWNANAFNNNQYSSLVHVSNTDNVSHLGVMTNVSGSGATTKGYAFLTKVSGGTQISELWKIVNNNITGLALRTDITWTNGDRIELEQENGQVRAMKNGSLLFSYDDSASPITGGKPGITIYGNQAAFGDNWEGGNYGTASTLVSVQDTLGIQLSEIITNSFLTSSRSDIVALQFIENRNINVVMSRSDTVALAIVEGSSSVAVTTSIADTLNLSISESSMVTVTGVISSFELYIRRYLNDVQ